ncbi:DUF3168 domain-containing protein [Bacillus sp. FJAT-49732]|uniref:DUF3168 domain-containing protein n=1 Tax=Lederbergia citrisecunda TaxID=2833583 RepID=A0A942TKX6_9BACI|nr:DUF3168 domain-containing protein [Lederbergia citrisecunda]MBS4198616.1 DUF3168 domain-containing protein [Lederbergia citrisecunda]
MSITDSFDAKAELLRTLESNAFLSKEVTGDFHNKVASEVDPFPRIVYQEISNSDSDFADNQAASSVVAFQISIYCDEETISKETKIAKEVDKVLKSIGYKRYDSIDLFEEDTRRHHKAMRYRKKVFT